MFPVAELVEELDQQMYQIAELAEELNELYLEAAGLSSRVRLLLAPVMYGVLVFRDLERASTAGTSAATGGFRDGISDSV